MKILIVSPLSQRRREEENYVQTVTRSRRVVRDVVSVSEETTSKFNCNMK